MHPGSPFILRNLRAVRPQPWKNGGGVTRELARGAGWRISVADVAASGPFSVFARHRRHSVVIEPRGLDLRQGATRVALDPLRCVSYDGGVAWQATLRAGATRVFNVMTHEGRASAEVRVGLGAAAAPARGLCLALSMTGDVSCAPDAAAPLALAACDYVLFSPAAGMVRFDASDAAAGLLVARIGPPCGPRRTSPSHRTHAP